MYDRRWMRRDEERLRTRLDLLGLALLALLGFAWEELVEGRVRHEFEKSKRN